MILDALALLELELLAKITESRKASVLFPADEGPEIPIVITFSSSFSLKLNLELELELRGEVGVGCAIVDVIRPSVRVCFWISRRIAC